MKTLPEILLERSQEQHNDIAYRFLTFNKEKELILTYGKLHERANFIADNLLQYVQPGDRALLLYPSGLEFIEAFYGCLLAGIIAVPAYLPRNNHNMNRLMSIIKDCEAQLILTDHSALRTLEKNLSGVDYISGLPIVETDSCLEGGTKETVRRINPEQIAFLQYTSGSTGSPKGVMVSHKNIVNNSMMISETMNTSKDYVAVHWLPMFHDMGLIGSLIQPLFIGFPSFLMSPNAFIQKPIRWLEAISKYKGTISGAPNFAYDLCIRSISEDQIKSINLESWKIAYSGAEPVNLNTLNAFANKFKQIGFNKTSIFPCYGMAEATLFISGDSHNEQFKSIQLDATSLHKNKVKIASHTTEKIISKVSCGKPFGNHEVVIVNPDTREKYSNGKVGEIWVSGPSIANGYWGKKELSKEVFHATIHGENSIDNKYLRTGDMGFLQDNELFITGRLKEMMIIRGKNYFPSDIEKTVEASHPALQENAAAAFSIDKDNSEYLIIAVELKRTAVRDYNPVEIIKKIREAVATAFELQVFDIVLLGPLRIPRTSSNKIQRGLCRQKYLNNDFVYLYRKNDKVLDADKKAEDIKDSEEQTGSIDSTIKQKVIKLLVSLISNATKKKQEEIDINNTFSSLGLDSLQAVHLSGKLQEKLRVELSDTIVYDYPTIDSMAAYISKQIEGKGDHINEDIQDRYIENEPIAIIGMECEFPGAKNADKFWELVINGKDAITEVPANRFDIEQYYSKEVKPGHIVSKHGGFIGDIECFDASFFAVSPKEAENIDPQQRKLLEISYRALQSAGSTLDKISGTKTGVFIGISKNEYGDLLMETDEGLNAYTCTGNSLSIAANRLSYYYNIHGPSISVDTACSSSLSAVHLACKSLKAKECTVAIAGASNLVLSPKISIALSQAQMLSPDGHCKAFDDSANGYVRGEGCAVVILKPLTEAEKDGDNILAIIEGSAVEQDGRSNGISAPNGLAQVSVLKKALKDAKLEPGDITFLESHGTGTKLGDPIEIKAINKVYGNDRDSMNPLYVGSVKANIGHLEAAAGMAGLIKAILSIQNKKFPAQIHFNKPNSHLSWKDLAISIPRDVVELTHIKTPVRGAVSSFGFGGTIANVILSEKTGISQLKERRETSKNILCLSGKSHSSMKQSIADYTEFIGTSACSLAEISFNTNVYRDHFAYRKAFAFKDKADLLGQLKSLNGGVLEAPPLNSTCKKSPVSNKNRVYELSEAKSSFSRLVKSGNPQFTGVNEEFSDKLNAENGVFLPTLNRNISFLFTGQGAQFAGMGKSLYGNISAFDQIINECAEKFTPYLNSDIRDILWGKNTDLLSNTKYTQPALFTLELALAKTWISWGICPDVLVGHSIGEYAAACVSGILTLDDSIKLISARGKLISELEERGEMFVAFCGQEKLMQILKKYESSVSVAAINKRNSCTVSGQSEHIKEIRASLEKIGVGTIELNVSHAFHSPLMNPVLDKFRVIAESVKYNEPQTTIISTVTGKVVSKEMLTAKYWVEHIVDPVNFYGATRNIKEKGSSIYLEIGPGSALAGMVAEEALPEDLFLSSIKNVPDQYKFMLGSLVELYQAGIKVNWEGFYDGEQFDKVKLPGYPFETRKYWIENNDDKGQNIAEHINGFIKALKNTNSANIKDFREIEDLAKEYIEGQSSGNNKSSSELLYKVEWIGKEVEKSPSAEIGNWLIFTNQTETESSIAKKIEDLGGYVIKVIEGDGFKQYDKKTYCISPYHEGDYSLLLKNITSEHGTVQILHCWSKEQKGSTSEGIEESLQKGLYSFFNLVKASLKYNYRVWCITQNAIATKANEEVLNPIQSTLWGLGKGIALESPEIWGGLIDLPIDNSLNATDTLINHLFENKYEEQAAIREGKRYVPRVVKTTPDLNGSPIVLESNATYLITGGTGGIGRHVMDYLLNNGAKNIALISRSKPRNLNDKIQKNHAQGIIIKHYKADISKFQETSELIIKIEKELPEIKGVFHAAGISGGYHSFSDLSIDILKETLKPKVYGTLILMDILKSKQLDFFVNFSSISSIFGSARQSHYSAANNFLDSLSFYKSNGCFPVYNYNWGPWAEEGMSSAPDVADYISLMGLNCIQPKFAIKALGQLLREKIPGAVILDVNWPTYYNIYNLGKERPLLEWIRNNIDLSVKEEATEGKSPLNSELLQEIQNTKDPEIQGQLIQNYLKKITANLLKSNESELDINLSLMEIGFDSILATQMVSKIEAELGIDIPLKDIFANPTISGISENILKHKFHQQLEITKSKKIDASPQLSFAQERILFLEQLDDKETQYNVPCLLHLKGDLNIEALNEAIKYIIDRHEILRSNYTNKNNRVEQTIKPKIDWSLQIKKNSDTGFTSKEDIKDDISSDLTKRFNLSSDTLIKGTLYVFEENEYILYIKMHHIITDGWSLNILINEIKEVYDAKLSNRIPQLKTVVNQYASYAKWQREYLKGEVFEKQAQYWKEKLHDSEILELPFCKRKSENISSKGGVLNFELTRQTTKAVKKLSVQNDATVFMTLLAVFKVLLHKYSNQSKISIGTPIANRNKTEYESTLGFFVNTLVLKSEIDQDNSFSQFLKNVKSTSLDAFANQDLPFEKVVEIVNPDRNVNSTPLFQVMFGVKNVIKNELSLSGITARTIDLSEVNVKFDLVLEFLEENEQLKGELAYKYDIFSQVEIEKLTWHFEKIIERIISNPEIKIRDIDIVTSDERNQLLLERNQTKFNFPQNKNILQLIEENVCIFPDKAAVKCGDKSLSYQELNNKANSLALEIQKLIKPDCKYIPILMNKCGEYSVTVLAILKLGLAFAPLDIKWPISRINRLVQDMKSNLLLVNSYGEKLVQKDEVLFGLTYKIEINEIYTEPKNLNIPIDLNSPMFVVHTSGTTGIPKGAINHHAGILNRFLYMNKRYGVHENDIILMTSNIAFDSTVWQLLWPLINGKTVIIPEQDDYLNLEDIIQLIDKHEVTFTDFVPSVFNMLVESLNSPEYKSISFKSLRQLVIGGEEMNARYIYDFKKRFPHISITNTYGPCETSIGTVFYEVPKESLEKIPIGKPIDNVICLVLDQNKNLVPDGVPGELYLGGVCTGLGYLNNKEQTEKSFMKLNFPEYKDLIFYKTGDLVKYLPDGNLVFLGRRDEQLKIMGVRVELKEIEHKILEIDGINQVVVSALKSQNTTKLVAYYTTSKQIGETEIKEKLKQTLPDVMIPGFFIVMEQFPLTPNGKINKKALPAPKEGANFSEEYVAPESDTEKRLAAIWQEVLGVKKIGVFDNFFEHGGHSLLAVQIANKIRSEFNVGLPLKAMFEFTNIRLAAKYIEVLKRQNKEIQQNESTKDTKVYEV